jgi:hypothetical protein
MVSILLHDALDFSTDHDDGGGQTRESLSRIASSLPSAAVAELDLARFAHQVRRSRHVARRHGVRRMKIPRSATSTTNQNAMLWDLTVSDLTA